jgi:hypothetical protein
MGRRRKEDVFLIGEESLLDQNPDPATLETRSGGDQEPVDFHSASLGQSPNAATRSRRGLVASALLATGLAAFATVELLGSGSSEPRGVPKTSARPALIQAPSAAPPRAPHSSRLPANPPERTRPRKQRGTPEREPAPTPMAPSGASPLPVAEPVPAPSPPSPSPPSSGGGPGGVEDFGFER